MNASAFSSNASTVAAGATFMDHALKLAARGGALASPNPLVGAVLVHDGRVLGEGFHTYEGIRHAEIIALAAAGESARGATLYINLEPCCHTGRTGPCTQALIAAGVARVVAAMADPNPAVAGRGFDQLRTAGIEVSTGLREAEARRLNESFARWIVSRKPLVTLKSALTLDGQLVLPRAKGTRAIKAPASCKMTAGFRRQNRAPKCSSCATPPTLCSPASERCSSTTRFSPIAQACRAAANCACRDGLAPAPAVARSKLVQSADGRRARFHSRKRRFPESARPAPRRSRSRASGGTRPEPGSTRRHRRARPP
jgi:pyrimidine deaminase RibD-like protein